MTRCGFQLSDVLLFLAAFTVSAKWDAAFLRGATVESRPSEDAAGKIKKQRINFKSGDLSLVGFLFKPAGKGPFPAVLWNHGSEKSPGRGNQYDGVADVFLPAGYVVFCPMRRGHGFSEGPYISDVVQEELQKNGREAANKKMVELMEGPQLDDQLAGLDYVKNLPYVDKNRLVVAGCSYGGIETLLAAERGAGLKAAIAMCPAAKSWNGNAILRERLIKAVDNINIPVLLIHPEMDDNVLPGYVLGQEFQRLGKPYGLKIYPPFGPDDTQGHCFGGARGDAHWAPDAIWFFKNVLDRVKQEQVKR